MLSIAQLYARAARAGLTDAAVWTPSGGAPTAIDGYFDAPYNPMDGMEGNRPCLRAPASILAGAQQGDLLTVGGVAYTVAEIALHTPDPHETLLWLRRSAASLLQLEASAGYLLNEDGTSRTVLEGV